MSRFILALLVCTIVSCAGVNERLGSVYSLHVTNGERSGSCTAFNVGTDLYLTAGHCYWWCQPGRCISIIDNGNGKTREVQFADYANVADYAAIIVLPDSDDRPWTLAGRVPVVGETLCYMSARVPEARQEICGTVTAVQYGRVYFDAPILGGSSGSPVYGRDRGVVGIAIRGASKEDGGVDKTVAQLIGRVIDLR